MEEKEMLELRALRLENEYLKGNIKKLNSIIQDQHYQLEDARKKIGYRLVERLRKIKNWRR